jgi:two-component system phosphate regulon response regulator PhoB
MKKLLVVDDNFHNRNLVCLTFELEPFEILMAENGEQALAVAQAEKPDVILLDVLMPGNLDGFSVCRRLRNNEQTKDSRIVMLTVKGQVWDKEAGYEAGADDYIVKPYSPLELKHRVTDLLEVRSVC